MRSRDEIQEDLDRIEDKEPIIALICTECNSISQDITKKIKYQCPICKILYSTTASAAQCITRHEEELEEEMREYIQLEIEDKQDRKEDNRDYYRTS